MRINQDIGILSLWHCRNHNSIVIYVNNTIKLSTNIPDIDHNMKTIILITLTTQTPPTIQNTLTT